MSRRERNVPMFVMTMKHIHPLDEEDLEKLYAWVDEVPLSRPKKNITRDFSDGVLAAEIVKYFLPRLVDLHSYVTAHSTNQKLSNWLLLNRKVLNKMKFELDGEVVRAVSNCRPNAIECVLLHLRDKIDYHLASQMSHTQLQSRRTGASDIAPMDYRPEADQGSYNNKYYDDYSYDPYNSMGRNSGGQGSVTNMTGIYSSGTSGQVHSNPRPSAPWLTQHGHHDRMMIDEEMAPRSDYEEKQTISDQKDQTIQMLYSKIERLEQLIHLKDLRIEDLSKKVEEMALPFATGGPHRGQQPPMRRQSQKQYAGGY